MIYITGDTHGYFDRIEDFCIDKRPKRSDVMIILGDSGINYHCNWKDEYKKDFIADLPITLFCIHGNHEKRPFDISNYIEASWRGGVVYREQKYPNILFAKDGEIRL